jgi:predicted nicotinamide N-methyase
MFKIPRRNLGVRTFANGIRIKTSTKLLVQDTGGDVWRGALALAKYLTADEPGSIQDKKVLELASGTGILGLSLILAGASHVTMSDKHNMTELILANAESNADILPFGRATVAPLDFSAPTMDEGVLDAGPFDTIVVSDVFYDEEIVIPFINTLRRLCTMSSSSARCVSPPYWKSMFPSHCSTPRHCT